MIVVHRQTKLLEIVGALGPAGGFARGLHGRQKQSDQDRNDCNHNQQLDQGEALRAQPSHWKHRCYPPLGYLRDEHDNGYEFSPSDT